MSPEWLDSLLQGLQAAQRLLRDAWYALGLAGDVAGQPAWPFAWRLAGEMLAIDAGQARRLALSLACAAAALAAVLLAVAWRRARWPAGAVAVLLLLAAPWPQPQLLLAPAVPTSLHRSPTDFTAGGIVAGRAVYEAHCARCHGLDGRGEGPDAAQQPMWPPLLTGGLLWKRLEGELFWRVRHGMRARDGRPTMPGFAERDISDGQIWQVLDYLQAHAAGQTLRETGAWERPLRLPQMALRCRHGVSSVRALQGQRLHVVLAGAAAGLPPEDPRLTIIVAGPLPAGEQAECQAPQDEALAALAVALGLAPEAAAGHELLADRAGWLRARGLPGQPAWSPDDLVCRAGQGAAAPVREAAVGDGLDALIRRMDAEPVRLVRGGLPH